MRLPYHPDLPVHHLAGIFRTTTNSYKFYWFLALLEQVSQGKRTCRIEDVIIQMIGMVWYPITNFKLSFGKQDQFDSSVQTIQKLLGCDKTISKGRLIDELKKNKEADDIQYLVRKLGRFVPQRLLRPWFAEELKNLRDQEKDKKTIELSDKHLTEGKICLYGINREEQLIEISPEWVHYLETHIHILRSFTYWHLIQYLRKHNPNVPNIAAKLLPPIQRDLKSARRFWRTYIESKGWVRCVYTDNKLMKENITIDHFLPWEYVSHDQLWNLTPTLKTTNSSKNDKLPFQESLYDDFASLQFEAFSIVHEKLNPKQLNLLEDYALLFQRETDQILSMGEKAFTKELKANLYPQYQIARNMGFPILEINHVE